MTLCTYSDGLFANRERKESYEVAATACCDVSAFPRDLEIALLTLYQLLKDYVVYNAMEILYESCSVGWITLAIFFHCVICILIRGKS
jgi:hypothetical protein